MEPVAELRQKILDVCTEPRTYVLVSPRTKQALFDHESRFDIDVHWANLIIYSDDESRRMAWIVPSPHVPDWQANILGPAQIYALPSVSVEVPA